MILPSLGIIFHLVLFSIAYSSFTKGISPYGGAIFSLPEDFRLQQAEQSKQAGFLLLSHKVLMLHD